MAFEPIYDVVAMDGRQKLCSDQIVVEARLIPPPGAAISKILTVSCVPDINASECFTGEARYTGKVSFKVLFVSAEGGNHCMDYIADFSDKLTSEGITTGMRPEFESRILDTDIVSVSSNELKLATVVEVELFAAASVRVKYLSGGGENIYTHEDEIEFCSLSAECSSTFTISDSLNDIKAVKLLMSEPKVITQRRNVGNDSVTVEGKAVCNMIFETADGMLMSRRLETPFSQQAGAAGATPSHLAIGNAKLAAFNINFETDGETSGVTAEFTIDLFTQIYADQSIKPIVDAFSVSHELLTTTESLNVIRNKLCATVEDRVEGSVTLDINMPIVDNILASAASKLHVSNAHAMNGKVLLEGIVTSGIIYYSAELNSKNSVAVELPFSLTLPCPVSDGDVINAAGIVDEVTVKIRRGNELDIKADICVSISAGEKTTKFVITNLTQGDEIQIPSSAISIHVAKAKETLWEVAKVLCTTPELILLQNPNLILPLSGGERIITYRHLARK